MFNYKIINNPKFIIDEKIVKKLFKEISLIDEKIQKWTLNIVFVDSIEIKKLNNTYRKIDKNTDVLSFNYFFEFDNLKKNEIVWELVFCEEKIIIQWEEYWLWQEKEFYKLLIHSILHIIWYDHEDDNDYKIMSNIENMLWNKIFWK